MKPLQRFKEFFKKDVYTYVPIDAEINKYIQSRFIEDYPNRRTPLDCYIAREYAIEFIEKNCLLKRIILPLEYNRSDIKFILLAVRPHKKHEQIIELDNLRRCTHFSTLENIFKIKVKKKITRNMSDIDPYGEEDWGDMFQ